MKAMLLIFTMACCSAFAAKTNIVENGDFEKWEWVPLAPGTAQWLMKQMEATGDTYFLEMRGPVVRQPAGYALFSNGKMVEGQDAYQGKSIHFKTEKTRYEVGMHGPFGGKLKMDHEYEYEVWLKGKGKFRVTVWLNSVDKTTLAQKWAGFPNKIDLDINSTNEWKCHQGKFTLPRENDTVEYSQDQSFAIILNPGTDLYVDNFRIVDLGQKTGAVK